MTDHHLPIIMEEVTDPVELAKAQAQWERFDRHTASGNKSPRHSITTVIIGEILLGRFAGCLDSLPAWQEEK